MSSQETGYGVEHGTGHDVAHTTGHEAGHGVETGEFWNNWWPLFVILLGFTFFVIVAVWHPNY